MPETGGSMTVRHDALMSVAAAMRADAADLDAVIDRLGRAAGATSSLARWPAAMPSTNAPKPRSPRSSRQDGARPMTRPTRPGR